VWGGSALGHLTGCAARRAHRRCAFGSLTFVIMRPTSIRYFFPMRITQIRQGIRSNGSKTTDSTILVDIIYQCRSEARAVFNRAIVCTRLVRMPVASYRTDYNTKFLMASRRFDRLAFPTNNRNIAIGRVISRANLHWSFLLIGYDFSRFVAHT
jgi:hypothetical protein